MVKIHRSHHLVATPIRFQLPETDVGLDHSNENTVDQPGKTTCERDSISRRELEEFLARDEIPLDVRCRFEGEVGEVIGAVSNWQLERITELSRGLMVDMFRRFSDGERDV